MRAGGRGGSYSSLWQGNTQFAWLAIVWVGVPSCVSVRKDIRKILWRETSSLLIVQYWHMGLKDILTLIIWISKSWWWCSAQCYSHFKNQSVWSVPVPKCLHITISIEQVFLQKWPPWHVTTLGSDDRLLITPHLDKRFCIPDSYKHNRHCCMCHCNVHHLNHGFYAADKGQARSLQPLKIQDFAAKLIH